MMVLMHKLDPVSQMGHGVMVGGQVNPILCLVVSVSAILGSTWCLGIILIYIYELFFPFSIKMFVFYCFSQGRTFCKNTNVSVGSCWRDCLIIKNTGSFFKSPRFDSYHPHGSTRPSLTPVPGDPTLLTSIVYVHTCRQNTHMKIIKS